MQEIQIQGGTGTAGSNQFLQQSVQLTPLQVVEVEEVIVVNQID
jgi:hypothetical protein